MRFALKYVWFIVLNIAYLFLGVGENCFENILIYSCLSSIFDMNIRVTIALFINFTPIVIPKLEFRN